MPTRYHLKVCTGCCLIVVLPHHDSSDSLGSQLSDSFGDVDEPHHEDPWSLPPQSEQDLGEPADGAGSDLEEVTSGGLKVRSAPILHLVFAQSFQVTTRVVKLKTTKKRLRKSGSKKARN